MVDHLLLHCPIALELWSIVFGLFRVYYVTQKSVVDLFAAWQGWFGNHRNCIIWKAVRHHVMWCIWREKDRNARSVENIKRNILDTKLFFLRTLLDWMSTMGWISLPLIYDLIDVCIHPVYFGWLIFLVLIKFYYLSIYIYIKGEKNRYVFGITVAFRIQFLLEKMMCYDEVLVTS